KLYSMVAQPLLQELGRFQNTKELEASSLYQKLRPDIEQVLGHLSYEDLTARPAVAGDSIRAVAWNIERGLCVDGVIQHLREHPLLAHADVVLLSELDWGMARTQNRFVAREIAAALRMHYAFAPCYVALTKGAGIEKNVGGENEESLHGNALLS